MFRQMLRSKQQLPQSECVHILKHEPRGILSVLGDGAYPYGFPIDHWYCEEDGKLYFHCGKAGHKLDAIGNHDKVSFCVCDSGVRKEGDWALTVRSVIVFGRIRVVADHDRAIALTRRLSLKYTPDTQYIEEEIQKYADELLCLELSIEHMTGKSVREA